MGIPRSSATFVPRILVFGAAALRHRFETWDSATQGFQIETSRSAEHAVGIVERARPDLVVIETPVTGTALPDLCACLRSAKRTQTLPIVLWSDRLDEFDSSSAPPANVEDVITPADPPTEGLPILKAVLRRKRPVALVGELRWGELRLDEAAHRVLAGKAEIALDPVMYRLLAIFMDQPTSVFSRDELVRRVWGREKPVDVRTIDAYTTRLRRILREHDQSNLVVSVRGVGYRFARSD